MEDALKMEQARLLIQNTPTFEKIQIDFMFELLVLCLSIGSFEVDLINYVVV